MASTRKGDKIMKKITEKSYQTISTIYVEEDGENIANFDIDFDSLTFDNREELEEYVRDQINENVSDIDEDNLREVVTRVAIAHEDTIE